MLASSVDPASLAGVAGILALVGPPVFSHCFRMVGTAVLALFVAAVLVVSATSAALASGGSPGGGEPMPLAEVAEDGRSLRIVPGGDAPVVRYAIEEWRAWAEEHLVRRLGEPVRIGEQEMPPEEFDRFGAVALAPSGDRVAFTATTYAMLTTVSVVGILELTDGSLNVVEQPATGSADELSWSPDGRYVAYSVDTARAAGERLRIDDARELDNELTVGAADLFEAVVAQGHDVGVQEAQAWLPRIRMLSWGDEGSLRFVSGDPRVGAREDADEDGALAAGADGVTWVISPKTGVLRGELIEQ